MDTIGLVICGMGGFGRELWGYLDTELHSSTHDKGDKSQLRRKPKSSAPSHSEILGFLDDNDDLAKIPAGVSSPRCLGKIQTYIPSTHEIFLISIATPFVRAKLWDRLNNHGAVFGTYIHPTAYVAVDAVIHAGAIICPNAIVNSGAVVHANALVNIFCNVGHDAVVGQHSVLSPYAAVQGSAVIGEQCFLGTRATVFPCVKVGNRCIVDSHSFAKQAVPDDHIVRCRTEYQVIHNRLSQSERKM